jgi:methyl-accepting chemotaxis protein
MNNDFTEAAQRFTQLWADLAGKMASAGTPFQPSSAPPEAARQMRDAFFSAMSSYAEQFMRSPEFLEQMKRNMDATLELRKQFNDFLTRVHHGGQGVALQDVNAIMQAIRHSEQRTLDRLDEISEQVRDLSRRVEALEDAGRNDNGRTPPGGPPSPTGKRAGRGGR